MSVRLKQVRNKYIDMVNKNKLSAAAQFTRLDTLLFNCQPLTYSFMEPISNV